jgi:Fic family protein
MYKPNYIITPEALSAVAEIAEIKAVIERSRVLPLNELQLKREALIRMVHTSTSIEGNRLAEHQVDRVLSGMSVAADDKSILEVKNYQSAVKEVEKLAKEKKQLTSELILDLHKLSMKGLLPEEKAGKFRVGEIYVVDDNGDGTEELRYQGPGPEDVSKLIKEMVDWYKKATEKEDLHPVLKAGILHLQFVSIHPFSDGNGRMARLLTQFSLYRDGWDFRKIIVLEEFYNKDRQEYYNAENIVQGDKYHEGQDITPWLEYFIAGFLVEARKVYKIINSLGFNKNTEKEQTVLDPDEVKIIDFLVSSNSMKSGDILKLLNVSKRTAQLKLKGLIEKKLIKPQGKGPATYYISAEN